MDVLPLDEYSCSLLEVVFREGGREVSEIGEKSSECSEIFKKLTQIYGMLRLFSRLITIYCSLIEQCNAHCDMCASVSTCKYVHIRTHIYVCVLARVRMCC